MQFVVAPEKCLTKILQSLLTFFYISQPFTCLSILSPNITIDFLLFELMSLLLINELSSLLSAFSLVDALSAFLCNGVDYFGSMYVLFLFSFFTFSVLLFSDFLEGSVNLESVINSVWVNIVLEFLFYSAGSFCFDSWFNKKLITLSFFLFVPLEKQCFLLIKWSAYLNCLIC